MKFQIGYGVCHGSFGELLQGQTLEEKQSFLVTLPIDKYSYATFLPNQGTNEINVSPSYKTKAKKVIELAKQKFNIQIGGNLNINSEIIEGKWLSSSSADLVSALRAFGNAFDLSIKTETIGMLISKIEPSDAVMYNQSIAFYNRQGICIKELDWVPKFYIVAVDSGGTIDTIDSYKLRESQKRSIHIRQEELLRKLINAFENDNIDIIGRISTESAIINQDVLYKSELPLLIDICNKYNLSGIVTAHTGTYSGLLIEKTRNSLGILRLVSSELKNLNLCFNIFTTLGF